MAAISRTQVFKSQAPPPQETSIAKCGICIDTIEKSQVTNKVNNQACKHLFHRKCFTSWNKQCWLDRRPTSCPLCKRIDPNAPVPNMPKRGGFRDLELYQVPENEFINLVATPIVLGTLMGLVMNQVTSSLPVTIVTAGIVSSIIGATFGGMQEGAIGIREGFRSQLGKKIAIGSAIGTTIMTGVAITAGTTI